jgi:glutamate transport system permease protein
MNSVLYDAPGPRTRRRTILASVIAVPVVIGLAYLFIYRPLDERGQFAWKLWAPILDPNSEYFPLVWARWRDGWYNTLKAAALSITASLVVGTFLALLRRELRERRRGYKQVTATALRAPARAWVEIARGTPVVVTIFFVFMVLPQYGIDFDDRLWYLVIGLTIYNSVVIGEILRSGMEGLHYGQREAALAVGLSPLQTSWFVLFPQAFRVMLPALISQLVVVLKDTSLGGLMISYEEALGVTKNMKEAFQSNENLAIGIQLYFSVGLMYIAVNYGLSKFAQFMQKRVGSRQRKVQTTTTMVAVESGRAA